MDGSALPPRENGTMPPILMKISPFIPKPLLRMCFLRSSIQMESRHKIHESETAISSCEQQLFEEVWLRGEQKAVGPRFRAAPISPGPGQSGRTRPVGQTPPSPGGGPPRHRRRAAVRSPRRPAQAPSPQYNWAQSGFIASLKKRSQNNKREARGSEDAANLQRSHLRQTRFYLRSICGLHKGDEIPTQEHTDPSSASNLWGLELPSRTRIKDISTSLAGRLACNKPSVNVRCDFHQQHYY